MNNDINVLYEDKDYIYISFDKKDGCIYVIVGMNDMFNYENILISEDNYVKLKKSDVNKFLSVRVNYVLRSENIGKDVLIGFSNDLVISECNYNDICVKWVKSYDGMTMSFISDELYDKYYLYEKNDYGFTLVCETEDFQVTLSSFKKGNYYFVEGYKKGENGYDLLGVSKCVKCECSFIKNSLKKLSIVVPVYNSEKFLCRCLDSIFLSSFNDFELILVDDGSVDSSPKIIDWYREMYGDIVKVIHMENRGVAFARNEGIKCASGDYIAFLDNDDFVHPHMYEKMYSFAVKENLDVVIGKVIIRKDLGNYSICLDVKNYNECFTYSYEKMMSEKFDNSFDNIFFVAIWNKIVRTDIVKKNLFFDNYYEDTAFTNTIYSYIDKFGFVKGSYYVWEKRNRKTIGTATNSYRKKLDILSLNKKYCNALFYAVYHGNNKRRDLLIYDAIRESIIYTKDVEVFDSNSDVFLVYKKEIIKINEMYNILNNPYLQVDKELYNDVLKILN